MIADWFVYPKYPTPERDEDRAARTRRIFNTKRHHTGATCAARSLIMLEERRRESTQLEATGADLTDFYTEHGISFPEEH